MFQGQGQFDLSMRGPAGVDSNQLEATARLTYCMAVNPADSLRSHHVTTLLDRLVRLIRGYFFLVELPSPFSSRTPTATLVSPDLSFRRIVIHYRHDGAP
jgi:hypothetical protein